MIRDCYIFSSRNRSDLFLTHFGRCQDFKDICPEKLKYIQVATPVCGTDNHSYISFEALLCARYRMNKSECVYYVHRKCDRSTERLWTGFDEYFKRKKQTIYFHITDLNYLHSGACIWHSEFPLMKPIFSVTSWFANRFPFKLATFESIL